MNAFTRFFVNAFDGFFNKKLWASVGGARSTTSSIEVSEETALNYSAVWCATRLISGTGASLPLPVFRGTEEERSKLREHRVWRLLNIAPNPEMTAFNFRAIMWQWQVNAGNAYAEIVREGKHPEAPLVSLHPLHPGRVKVMRDDGGMYYEIHNPGREPSFLEPWQMLHLPSIITHDGFVGRGVIEHARETIGAGIAAEKYGANWFGNSAVPKIVIEHPGRWNDETRNAFRKEWKQIYGGFDGDRIAILQGGAVAKPLSISAEDSQFLETRQFDVEEIARWYGIPPHLLQHLLRATFNNVEELGIDFVRYGLMPWLEIWEQSCRMKLFTPDEQEDLFVEHNVDALMRGNAAARANFYTAMTNAAIMNRNECRKLENLDPVEGGDVFLVQGATVPLTKDGKPESEFVSGGTQDGGDVVSADAPELAAGTDVQATALNGAQIVALVKKLDRFKPKQEEQPEKPSEPDAESIKYRLAENVLHGIKRDLSRLLTKESKAMASYAKKPDSFVGQVDRFYGCHRDLLLGLLQSQTVSLKPCFGLIDPFVLSEQWAHEGKALMLMIAGDVSAKDLPASVNRMIESETWLERPARAVEGAKHATLVL